MHTHADGSPSPLSACGAYGEHGNRGSAAGILRGAPARPGVMYVPVRQEPVPDALFLLPVCHEPLPVLHPETMTSF
jgi:hypothetical protein